MGIKDFFPWLDQSFASVHKDVAEMVKEFQDKQLHVIVDLTGEWRRMQCIIPAKIPGEANPMESSLTRFFPIDSLAHLDRLIVEATRGSRPDVQVQVWIVTDDGKVHVPIKEETRAQRRESTQKRLCELKVDHVSYKDVERIDNRSLLLADGKTLDEPIVADIFCNSQNRAFRIQLLEWMIENAQYFKWTIADRLQLNFIVEGVRPRSVIPVAKLSEGFREPRIETLDIPRQLTAEADVYIQHLVRHIARLGGSRRSEVVVSAVDSDICALLTAWTIDHHDRRREANGDSGSAEFFANVPVPRIGFLRFSNKTIIDVNALADHLTNLQVSASLFLSCCILSGTDFFKKERVLYGLGSSYVFHGALGTGKYLKDSFDVADKAHFEQLLVAAILSKEGKLERFSAADNRTLDSTRRWMLQSNKKIPKYVPGEWIYQTPDPKNSEPDASSTANDHLSTSYAKLPASARTHHWPAGDKSGEKRSVYQAFLDNFEYWVPVCPSGDIGSEQVN